MNRTTGQITTEKCYHCGLHLNDNSITAQLNDTAYSFCCQGCKHAFLLIQDEGLGSYYRSRTDFASRPDSEKQVEASLYRAIENRLIAKADTTSNNADDLSQRDITQATLSNNTELPNFLADTVLEANFLIRGIHCASCVWLNEKVLQRIDGVVSAEVQLTTSRVRLRWTPSKTSLSEIANSIAKIGYRLLPVHSDQNADLNISSVNLLKKMAVAGFFAGNIMLISISLYAGMFSFMDDLTKQFFHFVSWLFATPVYLYSGSEFFKSAWASVKHRVLGMDVLTASGISLAYFYSVYVTVSGNGEVFFDAVCFVVFAILIGRYIESRIRLKMWYYTSNLMSHVPEFARLTKDKLTPASLANQELNDNDFDIIPVDEITIGSRFIVYNGETLPADGRLLSDAAETDDSALTGEYRPQRRNTGDLLTAGSRLVSADPILIEASTDYESSTLCRIQKLAEDSFTHKPKSERLAGRAAAIFIGFVLVAGGITFLYWNFARHDLSAAILHTVALLIVACPCALSLSIPTAILVSMQQVFVKGCLIHKSDYLEILSKVKHFIFDKTGTLTTGQMHVAKVSHCSPDDKAGLLQFAKTMQASTNIEHPISRAFTAIDAATDSVQVESKYHVGKGIVARLSHSTSNEYYLGSKAFLESKGFMLPKDDTHDTEDKLATVIAFGRTENNNNTNKHFLCFFYLEDTVRNEARSVIESLNSIGQTEILTGDGEATAKEVADRIGITSYRASMSPEAKRDRVSEAAAKATTIMIGDGVNDTVALSAAHVGISFAEASRLALYSADILLLKPDLRLLPFMIQVSKRTRIKIIQNLSLSFGYNILLIPLAFMGFITPLLGAVFMSLSSICVVLNSLTLMKQTDHKPSA